jgi:hypothetical protein
MKHKKLKEMTVEELKKDANAYRIMTFILLGMGIILTFMEFFRNPLSLSCLGVLGFTISLTILVFLNVIIDTFELRLREVMKQ